MRLFTGLFAGRESIVSHSTALGTTADNLANLNTPGYKSTRAEFADLLAEGIGGMNSPQFAPGNGVTVNAVSSDMQASSIEFTNRELDMAIDGNGFFIVNDQANASDPNSYTRAGNFTVDETGLLSTYDGLAVLGFTEQSPETLTTLTVRSIEANAQATTAATLSGNLNAGSPLLPAPANPETFNELNTGTSYATPLTVVDSLGQEHTVLLQFTHTANLTWDVQAYVDGAEVGGAALAPTLVGQTALTFQPDGQQAADDPNSTLTVTPAWSNGSAAGNVAIDLSGFNSFATLSAVDALTVDGTRAGNVTGVTVLEDGTIRAGFNNGENENIGTIALSFFANPDGLERVGDNRYLESNTSGAPDVGDPLTGARGGIIGSSLETSNVDQSTEFVNIVRYQRGYQAGSKVISTHNELLEQTINIA